MQQHKNILDEFKYVFYPRSIAVFGATHDETLKYNLGNRFIETLIDFSFHGPVYPIGMGGGEFKGQKIYTSIHDIPGGVDYVIAAIPNRFIPGMMEDCGKKGVKVVHLFVSGFGEIEDKMGSGLQAEILKIANKYNIRLIGPNCMGVYCPESHMSYALYYSPVGGKVGYLSQSGGQSIMGVKEANRRGMYFSKVVSYGNASDINECDLIEYFTEDPKTDIITAYIEGTSNGPRLLKALKAAAVKKPVIIYKGGDTEGGAQAAASHTSAIAGSSRAWDALIKQTGVIRVYNVLEMFDVVTVLQHCPEIKSLNTLVFGHGGGSSVQVSDECSRAGLNIPTLPAQYRQALNDLYSSEAGSIFKNPLDINPYWGMKKVFDAFSTVDKWEGADFVLLFASPEQSSFHKRDHQYDVMSDALIGWARRSSKPTVLSMNINTLTGTDGLAEKALIKIADAGLAIIPSFKRTVNAVARVYKYYQWRKSHQ